MPSSKKNGYIWGFKRQDCVMWYDKEHNKTLGIIVGKLCRPVCKVEIWTHEGEHYVCLKSVCKAHHVKLEDFKYMLKKVPEYNEDEVLHVLAREVLWRKQV